MPSLWAESFLEAKVRDSSKGRVFRIKFPLSYAATRVVVCRATAQWNPPPSVTADLSEGRLQLRSRCGLEKSALPSRLTDGVEQDKPNQRASFIAE
jgi:hypothetical protein